MWAERRECRWSSLDRRGISHPLAGPTPATSKQTNGASTTMRGALAQERCVFGNPRPHQQSLYSLQEGDPPGEAGRIPVIISTVLWRTDLGSLNGSVAMLQQSGLGGQVASWLGSGLNAPMTSFVRLSVSSMSGSSPTSLGFRRTRHSGFCARPCRALWNVRARTAPYRRARRAQTRSRANPEPDWNPRAFGRFLDLGRSSGANHDTRNEMPP